MSDKEIDVRVTATTGGLKKGMDEAAGVVSDKSNLINRILKKNAEEAAAIARKQAKEAEDIAKKQMESVANAHKAGAEKMADVARSVQNTIIGIFSISAIKSFVMSTKDAVVEAEASFRGLESVANFSGVGIGKAMGEAAKLASDGLMTTAEASKALQNLLSRGYSLDQAVTTLTRLKDAAAYNRAAHQSMGEAVVSATEGLKNENSVLVDNAGVTKNVSVMWKEYAESIGKGANSLTQAEKVQAEYNGVMAETEAQVGNAAKASEGLQGKSAKLSSTFLNLKVSIGEVLTPSFELLAEIATWVIGKFDTFVRIIQISGAQIGKWGADVGAVFDAVANWDFSNLRSQLASNAEVLRDMVDDIMTAKPGSSFQASPDSGRRRAPATASPDTADKADKSGKKSDGPIDVFENGSFITSDKGAVDFIKKQFDAVNSLQGEMVREGEKAAKAMADAYRKSAQQQMQIDLIRAQSAREVELARITETEAAAQHQVNMGMMSKETLLALQAQFNAERLAAEQQFIAAKQQIALQDPDNPVELERIEAEKAEIRRRYAAQGMEIQRQQATESQAIWKSLTDTISGLWDKGVQALMNGTLTWKNATQAIGAEMVRWFATKVVGDMVKQWIAGKAKEIAVLLGFTATKKGIETAGAATTVGIKGAETTAVAGMNAVQAGTGAAASQASIPWVGPILAMAAMATVFAAVSSMGKKVPSAAGGFDIPRGMNPLTQLHEEEMVLPKNLANNVRNMTAKDRGAQQSVTNYVTMDIHTPDADSFRASQDQTIADLHSRLNSLSLGV